MAWSRSASAVALRSGLPMLMYVARRSRSVAAERSSATSIATGDSCPNTERRAGPGGHAAGYDGGKGPGLTSDGAVNGGQSVPSGGINGRFR